MKTMQVFFLMSLFFFIAMSGLDIAQGSDLDDGISKFTDDGIEKDDEMGKADLNIKFIVIYQINIWSIRGGSPGTFGK